MAIYMKIPGITGNVEADGYQGWIELHDVEFGSVVNPVRMHVGKAVDRNSAMPSFSQLIAIKGQDKSSINLYEAAHSNKVLPTVEIHCVTSGNPLFAYSKVKLSNVAVTHFSDRFNADSGKPNELIRLAYTQMERTTIPRDANNNPGTPMISGFDLEKAKQL